ncbi:MAG: hypothetical protein AAFY41_16400, partial [Bacteroidota bacterium]
MQEQSNLRHLFIALLVIFSALVLLRSFPALGITILLGIAILSMLSVGYAAFRWWQKRRLVVEENNSFTGKVKARIEHCRTKVTSFRAEIDRIDQARRELANQLERTPEASSIAEEKGLQLLQDFDSERALRLSKANFFEESVLQLEALLEQHKL